MKVGFFIFKDFLEKEFLLLQNMLKTKPKENTFMS